MARALWRPDVQVSVSLCNTPDLAGAVHNTGMEFTSDALFWRTLYALPIKTAKHAHSTKILYNEHRSYVLRTRTKHNRMGFSAFRTNLFRLLPKSYFSALKCDQIQLLDL